MSNTERGRTIRPRTRVVPRTALQDERLPIETGGSVRGLASTHRLASAGTATLSEDVARVRRRVCSRPGVETSRELLHDVSFMGTLYWSGH